MVELTKELDIEREQVLKFAESLQIELENWEKQKIEDADNNSRKKNADR